MKSKQREGEVKDEKHKSEKYQLKSKTESLAKVKYICLYNVILVLLTQENKELKKDVQNLKNELKKFNDSSSALLLRGKNDDNQESTGMKRQGL